ncbi:MAG: UbiA family prenyltransferase [Bacteroidia bacterium]|nr:UbiA family prenyltransferase [Bacteroidia bacterium]MCO5252811.1 UbiA family prenyltransferase [Bacteroidota bacterium]MCZ2131428.1 UbiA family prenyltransferase [Bacteroidia bacterium]
MDSRNIKYLKVLALMSSVRWYNILLTAVAQYISAGFIFNSFPEGLFIILFDIKLHLIVFCTLLIVAGGFLINDFYDFKHDMIVRPHVTLFQEFISKDFRIRLYAWLNMIALGLALLASLKLFLYFLFLAFALWVYSHKLKKYPLVKEVSSSLLTVSCFFSVGMHYGVVYWDVLAFGVYFTMLLFTRSIIKGQEEVKADIALQRNSIAGILGDDRTRLVINVSILIQLIYSGLLYLKFYPALWLFYIFFSNIILFGVLIGLQKLRQGEFYILNFVFKILIILGTLNLMFF